MDEEVVQLMTEAQGEQIINSLQTIMQQNTDTQTLLKVLIFAIGFIAALLLVNIFMKAWVRNT